MAKEVLHTSVDGQRVKLSNLDKVIYPSIGVTKAQVIQYYLEVAPLLLKYIYDRPLTTIRFPDGVDGKSFYSKDKPDWTPTWIGSQVIQHEEKSIDYLLAHNKATVVWLANLACLELHPMQFQQQDDMCPDQFIVDLDPDEGMPWDAVKEAAVRVRDFLNGYGYTSFLKTSGGKGLHIVVPIVPSVPYKVLTAHIKAITKRFVATYRKEYTLEIGKSKRKGKILIDIYRNHLTNTTVAPLSLRGKLGAPISMPISWEGLDGLLSSQAYTILNYKEHLDDNKDAWGNWREYEVPIYDSTTGQLANGIDARLENYIEKRDIQQTPEPPAVVNRRYKDHYVIQLHNASNLHYDLRLEDNGVLWSWAIPKSLPYKKGEKRLALRTEDHPVKYLQFEGLIPAGQYGAGEMWIFDTGKISWVTKSESSMEFILHGYYGRRQYKLYKTKNDDQWLIETTENYNYYRVDNPASPMLAAAAVAVPQGRDIKYEVKWDGIRVLIYANGDSISIMSRSGRDITSQFPELQLPDAFDVETCVLDGEIVVLDDQGRPIFSNVISRLHTKGERRIQILSRDRRVTCYLFDMLSIDGIDIVNQPLSRRQSWLSTILDTSYEYRISDVFDDGQFLLDAIRKKGMEGIMAKIQSSTYSVGYRSSDWLKIKCRSEDEAVIIGFTAGQGDRVGMIGALHLAKRIDERWTYMGKVGTGFNDDLLKTITMQVQRLSVMEQYVSADIEELHRTTWIEPLLSCIISYATMSNNDTYREPVFLKLKD